MRKIRVGDRVKLGSDFARHTEEYGIMEVWKIEDKTPDGSLQIFTKGGNHKLTVEQNFGLYGKNAFILVGSGNKITVNTRRKW